MIPGISTACFYPQYTEDSLRQLIENSYQPKCVELFINSGQELQTDYLKELHQMTTAAGVKIKSIHPYTSGLEPMYFFSAYDRRFEEGLDVYKKYYQAANILGADIVVFHGAMRNYKISYGEYFERYQKVWEAGKAMQVELCHENVQRCASFHPDFFREMARALPQAGFVFDTKQAVRAGEDVYEFAAAMGGQIRHIHISDHSPNDSCLVPGKGVLNIVKLLSIVQRNGFEGAVIVELYRENFGSIVDIFKGYQNISTAISTIT